MASPIGTRVTYPAGATDGTGVVAAVCPLADGRTAVVTDVTPFHPVDHSWPDQPADTGTLAGLPVVDCITGAVAPDGEVLWSGDVTVRRGEPGWAWVVGHVVTDPDGLTHGDEVSLAVHEGYRRELSQGHTACHLMAFAMNAELAPLWTKPVDRVDSFGNPDFDALAITESRVLPLGARDTYRLGKGLRKKGLPAAEVSDRLPQLQAAVNSRLAAWTEAGGAVRIETDGDDQLTTRRMWTATLPEGSAQMPCGGTHVTDLAELGRVTVEYTPTDEGFIARTTVHP